MDFEHRWDMLGVTGDQLKAGTVVMVATGPGPELNGDPAIICPATVIGPADEPNVWWLDMHVAPNVSLPQMYHAAQILGVPALSLTINATPSEFIAG